ncbi:MAG: hypothetical protein CML17_06370 [Pusillimonas sp.]|jgi:hypothetical protein|nr:hypothetical protein [Pusillimonas sp.]
MIHNHLERLAISAWPDDPLRVAPPEENALYPRVHARIERDAKQEAIGDIKRILTAGTGVFESYDSYGHKWVLPAGELFEALIENEESDDLAVILGAVLNPANGGKEKLESLIERFAQGHAQCVADATTSAALER